MTVKVTGLTKLVRDLQRLGIEVDEVKDAMADIAAEGAALAASFAPRRSGALAASVRGNRAKAKAVITAGRASVPYGPVINFGWPARNIAPSLFMQKADEAMKPRAVSKLESSIERLIRAKGLA